jgi:hypothetical protein
VIEKMERETGLEPATSSLGSWHSTTELLPLNWHFKYSKINRLRARPKSPSLRISVSSNNYRLPYELIRYSTKTNKTGRQKTDTKPAAIFSMAMHLFELSSASALHTLVLVKRRDQHEARKGREPGGRDHQPTLLRMCRARPRRVHRYPKPKRLPPKEVGCQSDLAG